MKIFVLLCLHGAFRPRVLHFEVPHWCYLRCYFNVCMCWKFCMRIYNFFSAREISDLRYRAYRRADACTSLRRPLIAKIRNWRRWIVIFFELIFYFGISSLSETLQRGDQSEVWVLRNAASRRSERVHLSRARHICTIADTRYANCSHAACHECECFTRTWGCRGPRLDIRWTRSPMDPDVPLTRIDPDVWDFSFSYAER